MAAPFRPYTGAEDAARRIHAMARGEDWRVVYPGARHDDEFRRMFLADAALVRDVITAFRSTPPPDEALATG